MSLRRQVSGLASGGRRSIRVPRQWRRYIGAVETRFEAYFFLVEPLALSVAGAAPRVLVRDHRN